ncbi:DUF4337 domain-containing protein [Sphingobium nicotianae]|uniref:DUF4337 family protein n=1 Tax=Sphingobium nicotianae TaxID=2782607 RepID=A0A9X1D9Q0_9SPHN|nr:DUF4337 domain-containing protein [Sphingobium nicotianae]MBT2185964.1 DUF4337 family protein [Sphingobium nicotianae]
MEVEVSAEAKDKRLNRMVAVTVVILSVFTGLCNIKDGNIVQAMQQAQSNSVDSWNEYQATKTKLHISEESRRQILLLADDDAARARAAAPLKALTASIDKYRGEVPSLQQQAQAYSAQYDALNVHDDQFDASEALISTAISLAAVAALTESKRLLHASWAFGAFGMFLGVCGFAKWGFHPDVLSNFLG